MSISLAELWEGEFVQSLLYSFFLGCHKRYQSSLFIAYLSDINCFNYGTGAEAFFQRKWNYSVSSILFTLLREFWLIWWCFKKNSPEIMNFEFRLVKLKAISWRKCSSFWYKIITLEMFWNKLHIQLELTNPISNHIISIIL